MTLEELRRLVDQAREAHPAWFALPSDKPPGDREIAAHSAQLGVQLPSEYLEFLRTFGGGDFAFVVAYSMDPNSDLNVALKNSAPWLRRADFVAVSDNGAGDYYGFEVSDGVCAPHLVLLDHETDEMRRTGDGDWLEFVAREGLRRREP